MLRVLVVLLPLTLIACSPDRPATTAFLKVDPSADPRQTQDRPGTQWNPLKAAAPKAGTSSSAWLEPSPSSFSFSADDSAWKTFTVRTSSDVDSVLVVVNPTGNDRALEVAGGSRPPSRDYCPAEGNDSPTRARRNGWSLHLSACAAGETEIVLFDHEQTELARYAIQVAEAKAEAEAEAGTGSSAWLEPSPASFSFTADDSAWKTFTVRTSSDVDSVLVVVNPTGKDRALEVAGGNRPPSRDYCPAEGNDSPTRARRNGWPLYLSVCEAGETEIVLFDHEQTELARYDVRVQEPSVESPRFNIELVFAPDIIEEDRQVFQDAARRWEEVIIGDLSDEEITNSVGSEWMDQVIKENPVIDDLLVFVAYNTEPYGPAAFAIQRWNRPQGDDVNLCAVGEIQFAPELRTDEIKYGGEIARPNILVYNIALHEIGHLVGIGSGGRWDELLRQITDPSLYEDILNNKVLPNDTHWLGPQAIAAYDDLGGDVYQGKKVPVWQLIPIHWRGLSRDTMSALGLDEEIRSKEVISTVSAAALADMGHEIDFSQAVRVPTDHENHFFQSAGKANATTDWMRGPAYWCGVGLEP